MAMLGGYQRGASFAGGVYENQYVRENGVWKFKDVRYLPQYSGRYEDPGWTGTKEPAPFHYKPEDVGSVVGAGSVVEAAFRQPMKLNDLATRMADLSARAQRLGDEIDVTNLQHSYGYYVDRKMWDDVADLFANDGTMEMGLQGVYAGPKSIRRGLNAAGPAGLAEGELNDHVHLQTIVTVEPDGRTARARGTDIGMTGKVGQQGLWSQAIYENVFVKQDGVWKFKTMHFYPRFIVDAEKGWAKDAQPAPGPSREFPPDKPSTETYGVYPAFSIAPLHFNHPVTGRPPHYPDGSTVAPPPAPAAAPRAATPAKTAAAIETLLAATELSVARSQAYQASENLATAYGYYIDEFMWDATADLFSRDGWKELAYVGTYAGRERVRESMKRRYPNPKSPNFLTVHQVVQPVIHVAADGKSAKIRTRLFQMGGAANAEGSWLIGIYENTTVLEDGAWKLSGMDLDYTWQGAKRGGWVNVKTPANPPEPALRREFPPDRALRGPVAPPFPKIETVPFHYKNPVSGRLPPLLLP